MSSAPSPHDRLGQLLGKLLDGGLSPDEGQELSERLRDDEEARHYYVRLMALHAGLLGRCAPPISPPGCQADHTVPADLLEDLSAMGLDHFVSTLPPPLPEGQSTESRSPILGFLGDVFRAGTDLFSRTIVLTLLWAVGLPGILLLILVLSVSRQPGPETPVAAVTRTYECVWSENSAAWWAGADVYADQRLELRQGLAEITFARGAKVLLEGPATFTVAGNGRGFLGDGSLVATAPKGAEGFTIQTPALAVVDLGTEFGVRVEDQKGTGDVEVFQGKVELQAAAKDNPENTLRHSLTIGQAARVEPAAAQTAMPTVRQVAPVASRFVRQMPATGAVVADFSGGEGNARSDQFPGAAGLGWAAGWNITPSQELSCAASIEELNPLRGGGKYLHVLVERKQGGTGGSASTVVERRLDLAKPVDLTKRHVVSFNLRVDTLNRFGEKTDRLSVCSRSVSKPQDDDGRLSTSGWHVCTVGKANEDGKTGNWVFFCRKKNGARSGVDSGIPVKEGNVYSFRILVDPQAGQWTPSIAVNGGKYTSFPPMRTRSKGTPQENGYWPFLNLFCAMNGGNAGADVERTGFSVDSIRIAPQ
jgi:hypothetical protein